MLFVFFTLLCNGLAGVGHKAAASALQQPVSLQDPVVALSLCTWHTLLVLYECSMCLQSVQNILIH